MVVSERPATLDIHLRPNHPSSTTHPAVSPIRRYHAAVTDSPIPVPRATYAAKQAGHLGMTARRRLGAAHLIKRPPALTFPIPRTPHSPAATWRPGESEACRAAALERQRGHERSPERAFIARLR